MLFLFNFFKFFFRMLILVIILEPSSMFLEQEKTRKLEKSVYVLHTFFINIYFEYNINIIYIANFMFKFYLNIILF